MRTANMPAGQGKDAERFAAAVESRTPLVSTDDAELAQDLEIVAMLRSRGAAYAPDSDAKARAKQRLMATLTEQEAPGAVPDQASRRGDTRPADTEQTAPLGHLTEPTSPAREDEDTDATAETTLMAPVTERLQPVSDASTGTDEDAETDADSETDEDTGTTVAPAPNRPSRASRRARHRVANRPAGGPRSGRRPASTGLRRRALLVGSAAMVMMLAIAGGGIFASRDALPGQSLYAIKQVTESAGLALTFDDASKGRRQLEIAATRLSEVERLAAQDPQGAPSPQVINETMDEFRAATDAGSQLLRESTDESADDPAADEATTSDLQDWATTQSERLSELRDELPATADADKAAELLDRLAGGGAEADGDASDCTGDDCSARRSSGENEADESEDADATEDSTSAPDESDSNDSTESDDEDEPTGTPTPTEDGENPQLLPDLGPDADQEREDGSSTSTTSGDEDSTSTSKSESDSDSEESGDQEGGDDVGVPVPLLPPVTLPPLLPGMPGITLG